MRPIGLIFFFSIMIWISGCKPDTDELTAGKGGQATLKVFPAHHMSLVHDCMIYLKYNAFSKPSSFDDSMRVLRLGDTSFAVFTQLKPGNYYVYGQGIDNNLDVVDGGIGFRVVEEKLTKIECPVME